MSGNHESPDLKLNRAATRPSTRRTTRAGRPDLGDGSYLHLAARLPPSDQSTDRLRDLISELDRPLKQIAASTAAVSSRLFRNARLDQLGGRPASAQEGGDRGRYDVAVFVALSSEDAAGELLDHEAMLEALDVLHTRGHAVVITPARNIRPITPASGSGRLNLIRHRRADARAAIAGAEPDAGSDSCELQLIQCELLVPIDPASTPFLRVERAQLDADRSRSLVISLARSNGEPSIACAARELPDLYWELPIAGPHLARTSTRAGSTVRWRSCTDRTPTTRVQEMNQ